MTDLAKDRGGEASARQPPPAAEKGEILKFDTSAALWLILFVFGGGLLALYYGGIGYFPEVSWQDALTYLALMTIIGGSLLVAYSFLLYVPGAIWSEFLIYDPQLRHGLMMPTRTWEPCVLSVTKRILFPFTLFMASCHFLLYVDGPPAFVVLGAVASLGAVSGLLARDLREGLEAASGRQARGHPPSADAVLNMSTLLRARLYVGASHILLLGTFIARAKLYLVPLWLFWIAAALPFAPFAILTFNSWIESRHWLPVFMRGTSHLSPAKGSRKAAPTPGQVRDQLSLLCRSILAFDSAALLSLAALWFFHRIYRGETSGVFGRSQVPSLLLLLCTLVVIVTNLCVSVLFHDHRRPALLASFLAALLLLGAGQLLPTSEARLPAKIMETFGFGGQSGMLVLTKKGGRILCQYAIPVEFEKPQAEVGAAGSGASAIVAGMRGGSTEKSVEGKPRDEGLARTAGVTILSRLGSEYLISSVALGKRKIALPKTEVVSWSARPQDVLTKVPDGCKVYVGQRDEGLR